MRNYILILLFLSPLCFLHRAGAQAILSVDTVTIACTQSNAVSVPLKATNFTNIGSFQGTIQWDPAKLTYTSHSALSPVFSGANVDINYNTDSVSVGKLYFIWTKFGGVTAPNGSLVFSINYNYVGPGFANISIPTNGNPLVIFEVSDKQGNTVLASTKSGGVSPSDSQAPTIACPANVSLQSNVPTAVNGIAPTSFADNCGTPTVGWSFTGATVQSNANDADASGETFNVGTTTVRYVATDMAGNSVNCSFLVQLIGNPPVIPDTLRLFAQALSPSCNAPFFVDITTQNFDSLGSLQFSLAWNPGAIKFDSVGLLNTQLDLDASNFNLSSSNTGLLGFLWTDVANYWGTTLPQNAILFRIYFKVISAPGSSSVIQFFDTPITREAYTSAVHPVMEVPAIYNSGSVNIVDSAPPTISCPSSSTTSVAPGQNTAMVSGLNATANDNCSNATINYVKNGATVGSGSGSANGTFNVGTTTVVYTATDASNNTATCSFLVTVEGGAAVMIMMDTLDMGCFQPGQVISVPINVANFTDIIGLSFNVGWDETVLSSPTITNIYPGIDFTNFPQFYQDTAIGLFHFFGSKPSWPDIPNGQAIFHLDFIVLEQNSSSGLFFIDLPSMPTEAVDQSYNSVPVETENGYFASIDVTPPVLVSCPSNMVVDPMQGGCDAMVTVTAPTATDDCGSVDIVSNHPSPIYEQGVTTVTYAATDNSGNVSTCTFRITVRDNIAPQFVSCPDDIVEDADSMSCSKAINWLDPAAFDGCGNTNFTIESNPPNGTTFLIGKTVVNYTVTDNSGNEGTCSFSVTINDVTPPQMICPADKTVTTDSGDCTAKVFWGLPTATDFCDPVLPLLGNFSPGVNLPIGITLIQYNTIDNSGNTAACEFEVEVKDGTPPQLSNCPSDMTVEVAIEGCVAVGQWDEPTMTPTCTQTGNTLTSSHAPGDTFPYGMTDVKYIATNANGVETTCSFMVSIEDSTPPAFLSFPTDMTFNLSEGECDTIVAWTEPNFFDLCVIDKVIQSHVSGETFDIGLHEVSYIVVDEHGNADTMSFSITVLDKTAPIISNCPADIVVSGAGDCGAIVNWDPITAVENCGQPFQIISSIMSGDTFPSGATQVNVLAVDNWGNFDTCTFTVTVNDVSSLQFINCPLDKLIQGCSTVVTWQEPKLIGQCFSGITVDSSHSSGSIFPIGLTEVQYSAIFNNDTLVTCKFRVVVNDPEPPKIACPENITVDISGRVISDVSGFVTAADTANNCMAARITYGLPAATDNCGIKEVKLMTGTASGAPFTIGTTTLRFRAEDISGKNAECTVNITVVPLSALEATIDPDPGCEGNMVELFVEAIQGAVYTWTGPQQNYPNTNVINILALSQGNTGLYTVQANIKGCVTPKDSATVVLVQKPDAIDDLDFKVKINETLDTINVALNDLLIPFGADAVFSLAAPVSGITNLGNGIFSFEGTENLGTFSFLYDLCSKSCPDKCDRAKVTINVQDTRCNFVPNIITPNGDGLNDWLDIPCIETGEYPDNEITIYNQWGDKVYEAKPYISNSSGGWEGTLNGVKGKDLPDGVYYYIFKPSEDHLVLKGFVEIYR